MEISEFGENKLKILLINFIPSNIIHSFSENFVIILIKFQNL